MQQQQRMQLPLPLLSGFFCLLWPGKQLPSTSPEEVTFWRQVSKINLWIQKQGRSVPRARGHRQSLCSVSLFPEELAFSRT